MACISLETLTCLDGFVVTALVDSDSELRVLIPYK
ncbi:hypothetical protein ACCE111639_03840 [Acinetobacter celticus]